MAFHSSAVAIQNVDRKLLPHCPFEHSKIRVERGEWEERVKRENQKKRIF